MGYFYECSFPIGSRSVDMFNHFRPSALLAYLQEAGTKASLDIHASREEMIRRYNAFWMLARIWFRIDRPLGWADILTVRTWHRGGKGVSMYRDFDLYVNGTRVGEAVSRWVLADQNTRAMVRMTDAKDYDKTSGGELCKSRNLQKLRVPEILRSVGSRLMRYSDVDINGHVNNSRYADFACDALPLTSFQENQFISSMQIGYLAECRSGEVLELFRNEGEDVQFVQGKGDDGVPRFDSTIEMNSL